MKSHRIPSLLILLAALGPCAAVHAGALLTKSRQHALGPLVEGESSVSLQLPNGAVDYKKEVLMWYTADHDVDTLLKAAHRAYSDGNFQAALVLFERSAAQEPETQFQAQSELQSLRDAVDHAAATAAATSSTNTTTLTPEDKIVRGQQLVQSGKAEIDSSHMDATTSAAAKSTGAKNVAEGNRLVAEGQKDLEERKAREAVEAAKQREIKDTLDQAKQAHAAIQTASEWTSEEKLVNLAAGILFALILLGMLWHIAMKEN